MFGELFVGGAFFGVEVFQVRKRLPREETCGDVIAQRRSSDQRVEIELHGVGPQHPRRSMHEDLK